MASILPAILSGWLAVQLYPFFRVRLLGILAFAITAGVAVVVGIAASVALAFAISGMGAPAGVNMGTMILQLIKQGILGSLVGAIGYLGWAIRRGRFAPKAGG